MLNGQLMATLLPPSLEDVTPSFGFHPRPKAVHALAPSNFGLPCPFRHTNPPPIRFTAGNYTLFSWSLQIRDSSRSLHMSVISLQSLTNSGLVWYRT
jgi:hypothetical protein